MDKEKLLLKMMRICSLRECCRSGIAAKLTACPPEMAEEILDRLCEEGYIDEKRYARAFARDKSSLEGWGILKIKLSLQRKGIAPETIAAALQEIDSQAAEGKLETLLRAKARSLEKESDPAKKQAKIFRYALGRGYGYDEIKKVYDIIRRDQRD